MTSVNVLRSFLISDILDYKPTLNEVGNPQMFDSATNTCHLPMETTTCRADADALSSNVMTSQIVTCPECRRFSAEYVTSRQCVWSSPRRLIHRPCLAYLDLPCTEEKAAPGCMPPSNKLAMASFQSRRSRTVFTEAQLTGLENRFDKQKYLSASDRAYLARASGLSVAQIKTWFQNRRMKWKKQVLASGCMKSPTKPKGRPKNNSLSPWIDVDAP